jgi:hypothetical protein
MRPRVNLPVLARAAMVAAITGLSAPTLHADDGNALLLDANYSKVLRWTFGGALFLSHDLGSEGGVGTIIGGSVGKNGMQVWGGRKLLGFGGADFRAVLTRTWDKPSGASANSSYVGGEVGFGGLVGRLSVGYAKRIAGSSTGAGHVVTWGIGMEVPLFFGNRQ